jgi:hypothetical protein
MNFSSLGRKLKLKFEILRNFGLQNFKLTRFYCMYRYILIHLMPLFQSIVGDGAGGCGSEVYKMVTALKQ